MSSKTPRDRPYNIPPRRRDTAEWLEEHERIGKLVLLTLFLVLPIIAMFWGMQEAWESWLADWRSYNTKHTTEGTSHND